MGADLRQRIAAAIRAAARECDGDCGLDEVTCFEQHPIQVSVIHFDEVAGVYGYVTALADVAASVAQPELDRVLAELDRTRAELATARGQLLHFAAEAHRRKWTYDTGDEGPTPDAFAVLHTIGNELRAAAVSAPTD